MSFVGIHNDGKEKSESFEAYVNIEDSIDLTGYGANKEEAIEELKKKVNGYIKILQEIDYSKITFVDCFGKPIKP